MTRRVPRPLVRPAVTVDKSLQSPPVGAEAHAVAAVAYRLQTFEQWCLEHPKQCDEIAGGPAASKLVLSGPRFSRFIGSVAAAVLWAERHGGTISADDIAKVKA